MGWYRYLVVAFLASVCSETPEFYPRTHWEPSSNTTQGAEWIQRHNLYRSFHGAPPVTWNIPAASAAQLYVYAIDTMKHSDSYNLSPPSGPAGENLAQGYLTPTDVVDAWYKEVSCCKWPGCETGSCQTLHFTAMIWKATTQIGCGYNPRTQIAICRYLKPGNIRGTFNSNVGQFIGSIAEPMGRT